MASPFAETTIEQAVQNLLNEYADCLDNDRLEEWPEHFIEDGCYFVQSRENIDAGLDGGYWMYHTSKAMLRDRVTSLRHINTYNKYYCRHLITNVKVVQQDDENFEANSNFLLVQVNFEGKVDSIRAGEYRDKIVMDDGKLKFKEKLVIPDTFHSQSALVKPL
jgi:anthranilate 1,2-dioxygenase small subunit